MSDERFKEYNLGDYVGKSGIERSWEQKLRGVNGGRQIEVDAKRAQPAHTYSVRIENDGGVEIVDLP